MSKLRLWKNVVGLIIDYRGPRSGPGAPVCTQHRIAGGVTSSTAARLSRVGYRRCTRVTTLRGVTPLLESRQHITVAAEEKSHAICITFVCEYI